MKGRIRKREQDPWIASRVRILQGVGLALFFLLLGRLYWLQVVKYREFRTLSENNRIRIRVVRAPRGVILDRKGVLIGVTQGYERRLDIVGVGYLAAIEGDILQLRVGFANEIHKKIPATLNVTCPDQTHVVVQGCDKQLVGQFAAEVRAVRKPEPYKGKGVRYEGEYVKIKPGKAAT